MIDLKPFCGLNDPRKYLNQPWHEDGATFACDGYIGIQLNEVRPEAVPVDPAMAGRISKALAETRSNIVPLKIEFPPEPPKPCGHCKGTGYLTIQACDECEGGSFEHGSHTYDCKECKAEGEIHSPARQTDAGAEACSICNGSGTISRPIALNANGITYGFHEKYLRLIVGLPGGRLYVGSDNTKTARFDFDGGIGALMPLRV